MRESFLITSHEQLATLSLPVRTEIVECVASLGPCSIRELADVMSQKRPVLHYHVDKLVAVGLLIPAGERGTGRRRQQLYSAPGKQVFIVYDRDDPRNVDLTTRYTKNLFTRAYRLLSRAFSSGTVQTSGPERDTYATQMTAWLAKEELVAVNKLIAELHSRLQPTKSSKNKRLYSLTLGLSPLHPEGEPEP